MLKNDYLPFDQLPKAENLPFEHLPRASLMCDVLGRIGLWLVLLAFLILRWSLPDEAGWINPGGWCLLLLALLHIGWPLLAWRYRRIALRQHDVLLEQGVIFRSLAAQAISRVQHVTLHQGPLQRLFGLATLVLYSAGKEGHFKLQHLSLAKAQALRDHVLQSVQAAHLPAAADKDTDADQPAVAA
jgi:membrane protein YdbS with pleckstrin-like domain